MAATYKVFGLQDSFLENLVGMAFETAGKDTGLPDSDIVAAVLAVVQMANLNSPTREATICLLRNVTQALCAAGWANRKPSN